MPTLVVAPLESPRGCARRGPARPPPPVRLSHLPHPPPRSFGARRVGLGGRAPRGGGGRPALLCRRPPPAAAVAQAGGTPQPHPAAARTPAAAARLTPLWRASPSRSTPRWRRVSGEGGGCPPRAVSQVPTARRWWRAVGAAGGGARGGRPGPRQPAQPGRRCRRPASSPRLGGGPRHCRPVARASARAPPFPPRRCQPRVRGWWGWRPAIAWPSIHPGRLPPHPSPRLPPSLGCHPLRRFGLRALAPRPHPRGWSGVRRARPPARPRAGASFPPPPRHTPVAPATTVHTPRPLPPPTPSSPVYEPVPRLTAWRPRICGISPRVPHQGGSPRGLG